MTTHRHRQRQGFKLIELIVVIVLFVILVGLLIPTPGHVRVSAERAEMTDKLRQLVIACHNAHDSYKKFPPSWGFYPSIEPAPNIPAQAKQRSLHFHILPYIEGARLYNASNTNAAFPPYTVSLDPTTVDGTDGAGRGVTSFLCNTHCFPAGPSYARMPDSFASGTSNVVFFVSATAKGRTDDGTSWHYWGGDPDQTKGVAHFLGNQRLPPLPLTDKIGPYQRGAQLTPGGFQVVMGDASTRTVHPHISAFVWQAVTNPANTEPVPNDWNQ